MGFFKVLGGVAAGIGTLVTLPVAGPIGAVTVFGAVVAGTAGAIVGGVASSMDKEELESARRSGEKEATAKYAARVDKLIEQLKEAEKRLKNDKSYFSLLIALFAVGMATANADGEVSEEEINELEEFCAGIAHSNLPEHVKEVITELKDNPPSFNTSMKYVKKLHGEVDLTLFEDVIQLVAESDGYVSIEEKALLEAFRKSAA